MAKLDEWIILETDDFIVLNKPAGLLSIPDREGKDVSLKKLLVERYGSIFTVHRLDKETSGLIVFAKNEESHKFLSKQFEDRSTTKIYQGLVMIGSPAEKKGRVDAPIAEHPHKKGVMLILRKGKESITDYEVLNEYGMYTLMQFHILTGHTHQIRVHMKHLGNPIVCDPVYGDGKPVFISSIKKKHYNLAKNELDERPILSRLALHAFQLSFTGPDRKEYSLEAPWPKDLKATIQQLEKQMKK